MAGKKVWDSAKTAAVDAGVAVVGGGVIGSVAGKYALLIGAPIALWGYHSNNRWAKVLGLGTMASTGYQSGPATTGAEAGLGEAESYGMEGVDGFDFAAAQKGAVTRVGGWFANIKGKLGIPAETGRAAAGLGEGDTNYFGNPLAGPAEYELAALGDGDFEPLPVGSVGSLGQTAGLGNLAGGRSGTGAII